MGDPKVHPRRQFERPRKPWDKARIEEEKQVKELYGLKNKREIWKAKTILRAKRKNARALLAMTLEKRGEKGKELIDSLIRQGILNEQATLDDILTLSESDLLERRLQTLVWRKGLANTCKQARQFIAHGHIAIEGKKVSVPGYIVLRDQESTISFYGTPIPLEEKKIEVKAGKVEKKAESSLRKKFEEVKEAAEKIEKEAKPEKKPAEKPAEKEKAEEKKPEAKPEEKKEAAKEGEK